jgi:hypothetical protein
VRVTVTVKTRDGVYLYPGEYTSDLPGFDFPDRVAIAQENFRLLNAGLIRRVDVKIEHNTLMANLILLACLSLSLAALWVVYRRSMHRARADHHATRERIDALSRERRASEARLAQLNTQHQRLADETAALQKELARQRQRAAHAEDQVIDEMVALEASINDHLARQHTHLEEIEALKAKIARSEKEAQDRRRQQLKAADSVRKRFDTLYKHIRVHQRAIDGYLDLTEELKIKAEEVVHQLNANSNQVAIKRKVFGKKNRETVFEVVFAYKGRLYFRNLPDRRSEILVIGTKLTQQQDLAFLNAR